MSKIITKYGYSIEFNNQAIGEDIEVYSEDGRLVCAFTKGDITRINRILKRYRIKN